MRPLILLSSLGSGGAEQVTVRFVTHPRVAALDPVLCTFTDRRDGPLAGEVGRAGVLRVDLGGRRRGDLRTVPRLVSLVRRESISLVHAHGPEAALVAGLGRRWSGVPLITTRHVLDDLTWNLRSGFHAWLAERAVFWADRPVAVSAAVARRIARRDAEDVRVLYNGIDLDRFVEADEARRDRTRRSLGAGPEDPVVLMPAALRPEKGHDLLLAAIPELVRSLPDLRVWLAGGGELETEIGRRAARWKDNVSVLGLRDDIPDLLEACDLVVLPSEAEGLPTALIEAAAAGRPVVATDVGGVAEIVEDGHTGLLVPPGDGQALRRAVLDLATDRTRSRRLGDAALEIARSRFSLERQVEETLALWRDVVAGETG